MKLSIRACTIEDLAVLRNFSYMTFDDTFRPMNSPSTMDDYMKQAFDMTRLRDELLNIHSSFYFLYADEQLAGYFKLNEAAAQTDIHDPESIEIERIYVDKKFQGKGLGSFLMNKAIDIAHTRQKSYIWLGVWEKNEKALRFYKRNGFSAIGTHSFFMGQEEQTDFIMRKDLLNK